MPAVPCGPTGFHCCRSACAASLYRGAALFVVELRFMVWGGRPDVGRMTARRAAHAGRIGGVQMGLYWRGAVGVQTLRLLKEGFMFARDCFWSDGGMGGMADGVLDGVTIVRLSPALCVSAWAYGAQPERAAFERLLAWLATGRRRPADLGTGERIFGFNNPPPESDSSVYGYELWRTLAPGEPRPASLGSIEARGGVVGDPELGEVASQYFDGTGLRVVFFAGGLYARMAFDAPVAAYAQAIPAAWQKLVEWVETTSQRPAHHQCLEEFAGDGTLVALYLPVGE